MAGWRAKWKKVEEGECYLEVALEVGEFLKEAEMVCRSTVSWNGLGVLCCK
jgi:hypothetical protein